MKTESPIFIAEVSANHLGSFSRAKDIVTAAIDSGATAVKFQTYTANTMTIDVDLPQFRISEDHTLWGGRKLFDLYNEAHTPWEWHRELFDMCLAKRVIPFSTPFDLSAVDFLETLQVPMYKIASMESGDIPLIKKVAETGKPLIVSTGATTWDEIEELVNTVELTGNKNLTLLVCTSSYPANPIDSHLNRIKTLRERFNVNVGVSDHTLGIGASLAAIGLGATVIEKHFTLRRSDGGPDGAFSMEPEEFKNLVVEGTNAYKSLGQSEWSTQASENESRRLRRSLYIVENVKAGDIITVDNLRAIRPNGGCPPKYLQILLGKKYRDNYFRGEPMDISFAID